MRIAIVLEVADREDAHATQQEVAWILRDLGERVTHCEPIEDGALWDYNGNAVGRIMVGDCLPAPVTGRHAPGRKHIIE